MDRGVEALVVKAHACRSRYVRALWFDGVTLSGNQLLVPSREVGESITRMFLSQLRTVIADLEIRVVGAVPVPQKSSLLKPSVSQALAKAKQVDLL